MRTAVSTAAAAAAASPGGPGTGASPVLKHFRMYAALNRAYLRQPSEQFWITDLIEIQQFILAPVLIADIDIIDNRWSVEQSIMLLKTEINLRSLVATQVGNHQARSVPFLDASPGRHELLDQLDMLFKPFPSPF